MSTTTEPAAKGPRWRALALRALTWLVAAGCFYLVWRRLAEAAAREGVTTLAYLADFFAGVSWGTWLALVIPYSVFFFLVDAHATWRVVRWFNAPGIRLRDVLPIRASAYILSLVNEQVGKGAMSLYLLRRHEVPGWEALSSMIFLGIVEIYQLMFWSAVGIVLRYDLLVDASEMLPLDVILPAVFVAAAIYAPVHLAYFSGRLLPRNQLREVPVLRALRRARPIHYLLTLIFKAPNLLGAVVVYTLALQLFNVDASFAQMLALLPTIFLAAALPLPFHAGALAMWTVMFPNYPEVSAFSLVMHTFFVVFNACIGVLFLPRANRELFGEAAASASASASASTSTSEPPPS